MEIKTYKIYDENAKRVSFINGTEIESHVDFTIIKNGLENVAVVPITWAVIKIEKGEE